MYISFQLLVSENFIFLIRVVFTEYCTITYKMVKLNKFYNNLENIQGEQVLSLGLG